MSSKEDCFEEAVEAYQNATGKNLDIEFQKPWRLMDNGNWERASNWWSAVRSFVQGDAAQIRRPDLTIGGKTVFDLKFTRADGTVDSWGTRPGQGTGTLQRDDYNDINRQTNPGLNNDDPKLDPETCQCKTRGAQRETVPMRSTSPYGIYVMPMAPLGGLPAFGPMPGFLPAPVLAPSSQHYKQDIAAADLGADRLLDLEVKAFRWRADGRADIGLIAEEVQETVPELFYQDAQFTGVQAAHLPYYLLQLVQAQQKVLQDLSDKITRLEAALADRQTP